MNKSKLDVIGNIPGVQYRISPTTGKKRAVKPKRVRPYPSDIYFWDGISRDIPRYSP